jgi:hypothetical protein
VEVVGSNPATPTHEKPFLLKAEEAFSFCEPQATGLKGEAKRKSLHFDIGEM